MNIPVPVTAYISKLDVILPIFGNTLLVIIWILYSVEADNYSEN